MSLSDSELRDLLAASHTIAVVGHSDKPYRASYTVAQYLRQAGYQVYPVNPTLEVVDGHKVYPSLSVLPGPVDIVNVFRRPQFLPFVVNEAIAVQAGALWGQLGVVHLAAAEVARKAGLAVVMDRCIMVEHTRLRVPHRA